MFCSKSGDGYVGVEVVASLSISEHKNLFIKMDKSTANRSPLNSCIDVVAAFEAAEPGVPPVLNSHRQ